MLPFAVACVAPFIRCTDDLIAFARAARAHTAIVRDAVRERRLVGARALPIATHLDLESFVDFVVVARNRTPWLRSVYIDMDCMWGISATTRNRAIAQLDEVSLTTESYSGFLNTSRHEAVNIGSHRIQHCLDLRNLDRRFRLYRIPAMRELQSLMSVAPQRMAIDSRTAAHHIETFARHPQCDIVVEMLDWVVCVPTCVELVHRNRCTIERAALAQAPGARVVFVLDRAYRRWWLRQWSSHTTSSCRDRTRIHTRGSIDIWWNAPEPAFNMQATLDLLHRTPLL